MNDQFNLFDSKPVLPAYSKPREDEVLSSWLIRLASDHHLKMSSFINLINPDTKNRITTWDKDIDRIKVPSVFTETLASKTNCTIQDVYTTTLRSYEGKLFENYYDAAKWLLPFSAARKINHKQNYSDYYCPGCLNKDGSKPYIRKRWKLALSFMCDKCGCYLHNTCPNCGSLVSFVKNIFNIQSQEPRKKLIDCYNCGHDLRTAEEINAPDSLKEMQCELYRIMEEGWHEKVFYPHLYFDVLYSIINFLISSSYYGNEKGITSFKKELFNFFVITPINRKSQTLERRYEFMSFDNRLSIMMMAFWLLEEWPDRFIYYCKKWRITPSSFLNDTTRPFWFAEIMGELTSSPHLKSVFNLWDRPLINPSKRLKELYALTDLHPVDKSRIGLKF